MSNFVFFVLVCMFAAIVIADVVIALLMLRRDKRTKEKEMENGS